MDAPIKNPCLPPRRLLFTPGPATTSDSVKLALITEDMSPRDARFVKTLDALRQRITAIAGSPERYATVLLSSSGTGAVEAMLLAAARQPGKILIVDNGAYGQRMAEMARTYAIDHAVWTSAPTAALDLQALREYLAAQAQPFAYLAVVHHETTTGLLNDIQALGALAHEQGTGLLVDAMSSFAALPTDLDALHCDMLASSANKNLQGMAGAAFVIIRRALIDKLAAFPPRSFYLDILAEFKAVEASGQGRFTLPVQILAALDQALGEFEQETRALRLQRYQGHWRVLHERLAALGFSFLLEPGIQSRLLLAVVEPQWPGFNFDELVARLKQSAIDIYPGKLPNVRYFRLCTVGDLTPADIQFTLARIEEYLDSLAVEAALPNMEVV